MLATKLYGSMSDWPNDTFLSARNIRRACDASLQRLQTDYIDLYQMHHVDRATPWEEIWEAFEVLRQQGKVLYFGSSNFAGWHIAQARRRRGARHCSGLVSEQSIYNLLTRDVELEVLPACLDYGLGVIPWSPLHGGLLGGILRKTEKGSDASTGRAKDDAREAPHRDRGVRGALRRARRAARPTSAWPGCSHQPASPRRSSGRAPWTSSTGTAAGDRDPADQGRPRPARRDLPRSRRPAPEAYAW